MTTIDVPVLIRPHANNDWVDVCLDSIQAAGGTPVVSHATTTHIGIERIKAINRCKTDYIAFVDDDDYIHPEALRICAEYLDQNDFLVGVYTDEVHLDEGGRIIGKGFHYREPWNPLTQLLNPSAVRHLFVARTEVVFQVYAAMEDYPTLEGYILRGAMAAYGPLGKVPFDGYFWRKHAGGAHHRTTDDNNFRTNALLSLKPLLHDIYRSGRWKESNAAIKHQEVELGAAVVDEPLYPPRQRVSETP